MPETDLLIPDLDQPPAQFTTSLPASRIRQEVAASGTRFGCWVLQAPDGQVLNEERDLHFAHQDEAVAQLVGILTYLHADQLRPVAVIAQLPLGCFTVSCTTCATPLGDEELGYRVAHFETLEAVERFAEDADWTTEGQGWNCADCPPLECPTGWRAGV